MGQIKRSKESTKLGQYNWEKMYGTRYVLAKKKKQRASSGWENTIEKVVMKKIYHTINLFAE